MTDGTDTYLTAALALLDEVGPADVGPGMSIAAMSAASGLGRSTIYRHWATVGDLNADLATHAATGADGWQRRLLSLDPASPTIEVFRSLVGAEPGLAARVSIGARPPGDPARQGAVEWERAWLTAAETWFDLHLGAHGRTCGPGGTRLVALAVTALIDGSLVLDRLWSLPDGSEWFTARNLDLAAATARLLGELTVAGPVQHPGDRPAAPGPAIAGPARTDALRRAIEVSATAPFGSPAALAPGRLVDPGRLARRLGVTERSVYSRWPTTRDANVAVLEALGERSLAAFDRAAQTVLSAGAVQPVPDTMVRVSAEVLQLYVARAASTDEVHTFQCTHAFSDPEVRAAFVDTTRRSADMIRTVFLALMNVSGTRVDPDVGADGYLAGMRSVIAGMQRMAALDPTLLDETSELDGEVHPTCGLACHLVLRSLSAHRDDLPHLPGRRSAPALELDPPG